VAGSRVDATGVPLGGVPKDWSTISIALSAVADSDRPHAAASAEKLAFTSREGRTVIDGDATFSKQLLVAKRPRRLCYWPFGTLMSLDFDE
jgi:hypothetical protein